MVLPMVVLGVASVFSGWIANPQVGFLGVPVHWFSEFLIPPLVKHAEVLPVDLGLASVSMLIAIMGMLFATAIYYSRLISSQRLSEGLRPVYIVISQKYYIDYLYERLFVFRLLYSGISALVDWFDRAVVDSAVDTIGWFWRNIGRAVSRIQTGQVQGYGASISVGVLLIVAAYLIWGRGTG